MKISHENKNYDIVSFSNLVHLSSLRLYSTYIHKMEYTKKEMKKEMATHSGTLACKISWTEEPEKLQSMESQRVGHD